MIWLSLALNLAGLVAFALGMEVHHRAVLGRAPSAATRLNFKTLGAMLQSFSLAAAIFSAGFGTGFVEWIAGLAACSFGLALLLSARAVGSTK